MAAIDFSADEKKILVQKLQSYLSEEADIKLGSFDTEFLLDFISAELGAYYYNKGLFDAQAVLESRLESIADAIYEIEQVTEFSK